VIVEDENRFLNKITNPLYFFINLNIEHIKDIQKGIEENRKILLPSRTQIFWNCLQNFCSIVIDILKEKQKKELLSLEAETSLNFKIEYQEVDSRFKREIESILKGKDENQLEILKKQIQAKLEEPKFFMDKNYWEGLLLGIRIEINKTRINKFYKDFKDHLNTSGVVLEKEEAIQEDSEQDKDINSDEENEKKKHEVMFTIKQPITEKFKNYLSQDEYQLQLKKSREQILSNKFKQFVRDAIGDKDILLLKEKLNLSQICSKLECDIKKAQDLKDFGQVQSETFKLSSNFKVNEVAFRNKQIQELQRKEKDEMLAHEKIAFNVLSLYAEDLKTEELNSIQQQDWIDTLTPRKPHYFNRVHFGYEWTNHNLIHYTLDNPPPKDVMGYRFNIFYPNLVDKTSVPSYQIEVTENPDFAIIKFNAGAPYEQLRFKIVNKEWDLADRKGFKCLFDRGILHLYFDFARNRFLI
jgi:hypothetical protein